MFSFDRPFFCFLLALFFSEFVCSRQKYYVERDSSARFDENGRAEWECWTIERTLCAMKLGPILKKDKRFLFSGLFLQELLLYVTTTRSHGTFVYGNQPFREIFQREN